MIQNQTNLNIMNLKSSFSFENNFTIYTRFNKSNNALWLAQFEATARSGANIFVIKTITMIVILKIRGSRDCSHVKAVPHEHISSRGNDRYNTDISYGYH